MLVRVLAVFALLAPGFPAYAIPTVEEALHNCIVRQGECRGDLLAMGEQALKERGELAAGDKLFNQREGDRVIVMIKHADGRTAPLDPKRLYIRKVAPGSPP